METEVSVMKAGYIDLSGKVIVSDPCYDRNVLNNAHNIGVKPGKYAAYITYSSGFGFGVKVACIIAVHSEHIKLLQTGMNLELCNANIGVDSGQCGIFDDTIYPLDDEFTGEYDDENSFYGECCKITLCDKRSGVLKSRKGLVSSSGLGDGVYDLFCHYHEGERVVLLVDFGLVKRHEVMRALFNS